MFYLEHALAHFCVWKPFGRYFAKTQRIRVTKLAPIGFVSDTEDLWMFYYPM